MGTPPGGQGGYKEAGSCQAGPGSVRGPPDREMLETSWERGQDGGLEAPSQPGSLIPSRDLRSLK